jgi:DNA (cytosine-5)-methyltransferase 3A
MNVLSLFDGISAGQVALERAGIKVDNYYASEIDKYAIQVTMKNYPNTIQIGDVINLDSSILPKIDLLFGGSPCQSFSIAGNGMGFDGKSGLFYEYVRLLKECNPKYFLLENVKMKKEWEDVISNLLGVKPIEINSNLVSAQNRKRLYWTNIPNIQIPEDKKILLKDIISYNREWRELGKWVYSKWGNITKLDRLKVLKSDKSSCLTTSKTHPANYYLNDERNKYTNLTSFEAEILQTFPIDYTSGIPEGKRFHALGNSWTIDVIAHIFKNLQ